MSTHGRHTSAAAGRAEAERRHPSNPTALARRTLEAADRERSLTDPPSDHTRSPDGFELRTQERLRRERRYA